MAVTGRPATGLVLARGLGRRMQEPDEAVSLDSDQAGAAAAGLKALVPVDDAGRGHVFLDYVLSALADAGCTDVILVVAPDHACLRERYGPDRLSRLAVRFVIQPEASGTAHAVLAAEAAIGARPFLVLNADNLYPVEVLQALVELDGPALPAFDRTALVAESGFPRARVAQFALIDVDDRGTLAGIREKPSPAELEAAGPHAPISMNVWRFDGRIFQSCRDVLRSARGEYELPEAVGLAVARGVVFRVIPARGAVLDLSRRADIAHVTARLSGREPRL
jgi:glucose-1-phosphate thymidylyltransferase